jgi:hypothetical protein
LLDIGGAFGALGLYFGCVRFLGDLFPRGVRFFDPIELEEIKIGICKKEIYVCPVSFEICWKQCKYINSHNQRDWMT